MSCECWCTKWRNRGSVLFSNGGDILKAEPNRYMLVWESYLNSAGFLRSPLPPSGRGDCETGLVSQLITYWLWINHLKEWLSTLESLFSQSMTIYLITMSQFLDLFLTPCWIWESQNINQLKEERKLAKSIDRKWHLFHCTLWTVNQ